VLKSSIGLGFRADVRVEVDPQSDLPRGYYADLAMVGGGTTVYPRSWEISAESADSFSENPDHLLAFLAEKIGELFPYAPDAEQA
jgi:hypothetical protein